jgi:hypothetical protein
VAPEGCCARCLFALKDSVKEASEAVDIPALCAPDPNKPRAVRCGRCAKSNKPCVRVRLAQLRRCTAPADMSQLPKNDRDLQTRAQAFRAAVTAFNTAVGVEDDAGLAAARKLVSDRYAAMRLRLDDDPAALVPGGENASRKRKAVRDSDSDALLAELRGMRQELGAGLAALGRMFAQVKGLDYEAYLDGELAGEPVGAAVPTQDSVGGGA